MSLFEALLMGALRDALEEADGQRAPANVTRTNRYVFHNQHSGPVNLSRDRRTAARLSPMLRFDQGIVFSDQPLRDNEVFEVRIDQMIPLWNGSIEIGVTALNPVIIRLPATMTEMKIGTWMLSGNQIVKDSSIIKRGYGGNLNGLTVGDRVGVTRTGEGALHFFINGKHQGLAATGVPQGVYAVVDIYGRCTQVSISSPGGPSTPPAITPAPIPSVSVVSSDNDEMRRYRKQRQWIQECRRVPFSLWLLKELSSASSDEEKREVFLFINCFGHRLSQNTVTCDGCNNDVPYVGQIRYRCMQCEDLDLCGTCFRNKRTPKEHELNHKVAEMRWRCDGNDCGGLITGSRFHCLVCDNFDLCHGCHATKNWPARHSTNHSMEKSSTLRTIQGGSGGGSGAAAGASVTDGFCPGQHNFAVGQCVVCKSCGNCTGYGANCVEKGKPNRYKGGLCGCGIGDSGCLRCKICKDCAGKRRSRGGNVPPPATPGSQNCKYREMCARFVDSLKIPDEYFDKTPAYNKCFCEDCHKKRGDKDCYTRGKPAKTYGLPVGWSRFSIKAPPQAKVLKVFEEWHVAFHGTQAKYVQGILNNGSLLMAGDVALGGSEISEGDGHYNSNWKPPGFDTKKIFVSPSIRYAGCPVYSKKQSFTDPATRKTISAQVALQVLIRPGCYDIAKTTVERAQPFDPYFNDNELEWSTKERGGVMVTGLLVKINE